MCTVFGGSGFLGRRIVANMVAANWNVRVAVRDPDLAARLFEAGKQSPITCVETDIREPRRVAAAIEGVAAAVNAVGLYLERGADSFDSVHVEGAQNVARAAAEAQIRLVHISGIGADPGSPSAYVRARGAGERAVQAADPSAVILRPSVLFGPEDSFVNMFARIAMFSPILPLFGSGATRLQPVFVDDVARAAMAVADGRAKAGEIYELGGPDVLTYRDLLRRVLAHFGRRRMLLPVPYFVWRSMATVVDVLPNPPLTHDQVILMSHDNVAAVERPGWAELEIRPTPLSDVLPLYARPHIRRSTESGS